MKSTYEKIDELYNKNEIIFRMALSWIIHDGTNNLSKITDEQIENAKVSMMDDEWAKELYRTTRELAQIEENEGLAIYKYIQLNKILQTIGFKKKKRD